MLPKRRLDRKEEKKNKKETVYASKREYNGTGMFIYW
jgi:hypothetical protein